MEELLSTDISVKSAKARLQERMSKVKGDSGERGNETKCRRLQDLEDETMRGEDPGRVSELFERYTARST
jgi:hypothetical protein